jgi:18S rRNA (guanine1575-N7)-methyltransferase
MGLDEQGCILDIGCGSGISGEVLTEYGHHWVGLDISPHMLLVAKERETEGDIILNDMGHGFKFRPGSFDGCVSISALQWLCNRDRHNHVPYKRLCTFFQSLFNCMKHGARAVLQFYPEHANQLEMITSAAMRCGFNGGMVVDFPHSAKAKKYFLVLNAGTTSRELPTPLTGEETEEQQSIRNQERDEKRKKFFKTTEKKKVVKSKQWIQNKKEKMRLKGRDCANDSKFTARKRKPKF